MTTDSDTAVVSAALRDVAGGIEPNPELVRIVRRRGRARRNRRNALYVATAAVLALAVAGGAVQWYTPFGKADLSPGWAEAWTGTRGDLIGDQAYLNSVKAAWKGSHRASANAVRGIFDDLRGEPEVKWAAHTPAGRAAVVTQRARLHRHGALSPDDAGRMATLVGFVSDIDGRPTVVDDDYNPGGTPELTGFFAGADRSTLIVIDFAESLKYSTSNEYQPDGTVTRDWKPLPFQQGVAVVAMPKGVATSGVFVADDPAQPLTYRLANTGDQWTRHQDHRLQWFSGGFPLTGPDTPTSWDAGQQACEALSPVGVGLALAKFYTGWCATGTTPDGRSVVVGEKQLDDDPSYLYYALGSGASIRYGNAGPVDASKPVPVLFALPDQQGFVAVRKDATLRYRVGNGAWQGERHNAALLPPEATEVQMTPAGGQETVVPIK